MPLLTNYQMPTQLLYSSHPFDPKLLVKPKGAGACKPEAWIWTSTYTPDGDYASDWLRYVDEEGSGFGAGKFTLLEFAPTNVFQVDSVQDLNEFMTKGVRAYPPIAHLEQFGVEWTLTLKAHGASAMHLTEKGYHETRRSRPYDTNSWDCESTAWVNKPTIVSYKALDLG